MSTGSTKMRVLVKILAIIGTSGRRSSQSAFGQSTATIRQDFQLCSLEPKYGHILAYEPKLTKIKPLYFHFHFKSEQSTLNFINVGP